MSTGESTEEIPTGDALKPLRTAFAKMHFAMQGLWERSKALWAAMQSESERGPDPDYTPWDDERRVLINIIRKQTESAGGGNYIEGPRNNDNGVKILVLSVGATLLVAFIGGGWVLSNRVAALEARVTEWQAAMTQRQNAADQRIDRLENRR